jgi:hypothetical protein
MLLFSLVLSLIALFTSPAVAEQSSACSLLTSSDIEVVTGGKMGVTQPLHFDDVPAGPNRSMKVLGCLYAVPSQQGQIAISWFTGPVTDEDIAKLITMSKNNVGTDALRKANYKESQRIFLMPGARPLHPQPLPRMAYRCPPVPAGQRARLFRSRS